MDSEIITETSDVVEPPVSLPLNQPPTPTTPQETARAPRRPHRVRPLSMSGLPSSLSTLRPASLPMPSAMPRLFEHTDERTRAQAIRETMLSTFADGGEVKRHVVAMDDVPEEAELETQETDISDEVTEREAEILKLVAASMPSHRSAWKRDSGAWRTFIGRQKGKDAEKASTEEEDEDTSNGEGAAYYDESEDESEEEPKGAPCVYLLSRIVLSSRRRVPQLTGPARPSPSPSRSPSARSEARGQPACPRCCRRARSRKGTDRRILLLSTRPPLPHSAAHRTRRATAPVPSTRAHSISLRRTTRRGRRTRRSWMRRTWRARGRGGSR